MYAAFLGFLMISVGGAEVKLLKITGNFGKLNAKFKQIQYIINTY